MLTIIAQAGEKKAIKCVSDYIRRLKDSVLPKNNLE